MRMVWVIPLLAGAVQGELRTTRNPVEENQSRLFEKMVSGAIIGSVSGVEARLFPGFQGLSGPSLSALFPPLWPARQLLAGGSEFLALLGAT